jgi:hypothetical protein
MGIDYIVDLDCEAKQQLSTEGIVQLVKARSRAEFVLEMARDKGDQRPTSQITFAVGVNLAGKVEKSDVSVQQLLDQAAPLEQHRAACARCPANRGSANGFGCYASINYPLEADTEKFLLSRLPDQLDTPDGVLLSRAMRDFAWDGAQASDMRSQGDTFFRLREPPTRQWPGLAITGDQLFHMLFHVGHLGSSHAMMLCVFFGFYAVGEDEPQRLSTVPLESQNADQMVYFLNTLAFAASQKLDILIDG